MWMSDSLVMSIHSRAHILNAILGYCDDTPCSARYIIIKKMLLKCVDASWKIDS